MPKGCILGGPFGVLFGTFGHQFCCPISRIIFGAVGKPGAGGSGVLDGGGIPSDIPSGYREVDLKRLRPVLDWRGVSSELRPLPPAPTSEYRPSQWDSTEKQGQERSSCKYVKYRLSQWRPLRSMSNTGFLSGAPLRSRATYKYVKYRLSQWGSTEKQGQGRT